MVKLTLPTDSAERKSVPLLSGLFRYFPAALAGVARISKLGNEKHNPGEEMHHARGKSMDHGDCILRHTMDLEDLKAYIERSPQTDTRAVDELLTEARYRAWRALAELQELEEKHGGAPLAPGAKLPVVSLEKAVEGVPAPAYVFRGDLIGRSLGGAEFRAGGAAQLKLYGSTDAEAKSVKAMRDRLGLDY